MTVSELMKILNALTHDELAGLLAEVKSSLWSGEAGVLPIVVQAGSPEVGGSLQFPAKLQTHKADTIG